MTIRYWPGGRLVGIALGAGRVALGAAFLARPIAATTALGADRGTARRIAWLARLAAVRDIVLGSGALLTVGDPPAQARWLLAGAAADVADAAIITDAIRRGPLTPVRAYPMVAGAAAAAGLAVLAVLDRRRSSR
jgi:hypothetical protein